MKPEINLLLSKVLSLREYELSAELPPTITVDDKSMEIILQIEKDLEVFKEMHFDDQRILVIRPHHDVPVPAEISSTWFWFNSSRVQEIHSLFITNCSGFCFSISNKVYMRQDPAEITIRHNLVDLLTHFRESILQTINWIKSDNAKSYREWIRRYMPKKLRTGIISRKEYNSIVGIDSEKKEMEQEACKIISRANPIRIEKMTLRDYIKYWCLCLRNLGRTKSYVDTNDIEMFTHLNPWGSNLYLYDLDSPEEFVKWTENHGTHQYDLIYARLSLFPLNWNDGKWELRLGFDDLYWNYAISIIVGLDREGIHFSQYEDFLPRLTEQDYLIVSRLQHYTEFHSKQFGKNIIIGRPYINLESEEPEHIKALIKATQWLEDEYPEIAAP